MFATNDRVKTPMGVGVIVEAEPKGTNGTLSDRYRVRLMNGSGLTPWLYVAHYMKMNGRLRANVSWFYGKRYQGVMSLLESAGDSKPDTSSDRPTDDPRYQRGAH